MARLGAHQIWQPADVTIFQHALRVLFHSLELLRKLSQLLRVLQQVICGHAYGQAGRVGPSKTERISLVDNTGFA